MKHGPGLTGPIPWGEAPTGTTHAHRHTNAYWMQQTAKGWLFWSHMHQKWVSDNSWGNTVVTVALHTTPLHFIPPKQSPAECNTWRAPMATTLKISALLLLFVLVSVLEYHWYPS